MQKYILKLLYSFLFLFVLVGTLVGCKTTNALPPTKTEISKTITVKEIVRDTVFTVQKDSSYFKAWLECKNGQVLLKPNNKITRGKYLQPPKIIIKDNVLEVDCKAEAQKLFAQWKDVYKTENNQTIITNTIEVERQLTFLQTAQIWLGRILLLLILALVTMSILKNKNII